MIRLAPAAPYPATPPEPPELETAPPGSVLFHGDLHAGKNALASSQMFWARLDLELLEIPLVQVGDMTEDATATQDAEAVAHLEDLPAPWVEALVGNHDLRAVAGYVRTGQEAAAAFGSPFTWSRDLGPVVLLGVNPREVSGAMTIHAEEIDWLAAELEAATKDCWIAYHASLGNGHFSGYYMAAPDATLKAMLDARPAATAWMGGHTHTSTAHPGFAAMLNLGSRSIANVNVSAIAYVNNEPTNPCQSILAMHREGGVDLKIRDHRLRGYREWIEGGLVRSLGPS